MKKARTRIALLLSILMVMGILVGCNETPTGTTNGSSDSTVEVDTNLTDDNPVENEDFVEAADLEGTMVRVPSPENLDKIVITSWKGAYGSAVLLGQIDKVVGMCDTTNFIWLRHAFPQVAGVKNYGAFEEVNIEEILQDSPDVVIAPSTAPTAIEKMRELDMPVMADGVEILDSSDVFLQTYGEIDLLARLTGSTDKAEQYFAWSDDLFALVAERVADIPDEERVTVLPIRNDIIQVFGSNGIWGHVVEMAGGINLAADATAGNSDFIADVDAEQVVGWNPDMMFQINFNGEFTNEAAEKYHNWAKDPRFSDMASLKSGDVYLIPHGIDYWDAVIEAPLCALWMAKIMYPERFEDIDVKEYANEFYQTYLGYEMDDEDWALMAPQFNGANSNGLSS